MTQTGKLGIAESRLGNMLLASAGVDATSPSANAASAKLGASASMLGHIMLALSGADGPRVFNMRAVSALELVSSADRDAEIIGRPSPRWALGGIDGVLGNARLAYVEEDLRPLTAALTGMLGAAASTLGNVRLALGEQEGDSGANAFQASATVALSLESSAVCKAAYVRDTSNTLSVNHSASLTKTLALGADSAIDIGTEVSVTPSVWGYDVVADNDLELTTEAAVTTDAWLYEVSAQNVLSPTGQAAGAIGTIFTISVENNLELNVDAGFTADEWIHDLSASNLLELAHETTVATDEWVFALAAENAISMSHEATGSFILEAGAESALTFAQEGDFGFVRTVTAETALGIAQEAGGTVNHEYEVWGWSVLELDQNASTNNALAVSAGNTLNVGQDLYVIRPWYVSAESVLQESHQEFTPGTIEIVEVTTGLDSSASVNAVLNRTARSPLSLAQTTHFSFVMPGGVLVSAENALSLDQGAWITRLGDAINTLSLSQSATAYNGPPLGSAIEFRQAAGVSVVRNRDARSELDLEQAVTYILIRRGAVNLFDYAPAGLVPLQGPYPGVTASFALIYPASGPATDTLELCSPDLGNKDRLSFTRINRESRGGALTVFADPIWPKVQTLALSFSALRRTEAQGLLRFLRDHIGREIKLTDWERRVWRGVITTPNEAVIQDGKESFSASFEFEGELVSP